jgi:hypothetical protein
MVSVQHGRRRWQVYRDSDILGIATNLGIFGPAIKISVTGGIFSRALPELYFEYVWRWRELWTQLENRIANI